MFYKKGVFKNFTKFTEKHLCQSLLFSLRPATLLKKRIWHRCTNFEKFLGAPISIEHLWWLLLTKLICETHVEIYWKIISLAKSFLQQLKSVRNKIEQLVKLKKFRRWTFSQNCRQIHFKNLAANQRANAAKFLKCVWPFWNIMY